MLGTTQNLRQYLRSASASAHDLLDRTMRAVAGWETQADYARFLWLQHAARGPVEAWLAKNAPAHRHPPAQTPLIAQDLAALGELDRIDRQHFQSAFAQSSLEASAGVSNGAALGAAWALAGSALGNKAILAEVRRYSRAHTDQSNKASWPERFLADGAMIAFWKALRPQIECPAPAHQAQAAARAADAVFAHFQATLERGETAPISLRESPSMSPHETGAAL